MVIKRNIYLNELISKKHNHLIKVITGIRRCGKSFLLFNLFYNHLLSEDVPDNHIIKMAFDLYENKEYRDPEVFFPYLKSQISDKETYYVLLDEVQLLGDFEAILNSLLNMGNIDVYVTGSNAKFLSKDIVTEFRGRGDEVRMYPLSFKEFMSVYSGDKYDGWHEYMLYGGIPLTLEYKNTEQKIHFLKNLFTETYISDIINRHKVRNKGELEEILNILSSSIGSLTNPTKLSNTFKSVKNKTISKNTIKNYIDYFSDSFLLDGAMRYDIKGKNYINTPSKYYFTDLGLRNARLNFRQIEESHAMENIIFNELKIRGFNVDIGLIVANEVDNKRKKIRKQYEIDFICNKGSNRYYIQSALSIPDERKRMQEQKSLLMTEDGFKKIIITKDVPSYFYDDYGILTVNLFDFLLDDKFSNFLN